MLRRRFLGAAAGGIAGVVVSSWLSAGRTHALAPGTSGSLLGERVIVYSIPHQRVWLFDSNLALAKTHLVSGRNGNPPRGHYRAYSKSPTSFSLNNPAVQWTHMVRFYKTPRGANIGFHAIPVRCRESGTCVPLQTEGQLGTPRSSGCVRQRPSDARFLYDWAPIGTFVLVV